MAGFFFSLYMDPRLTAFVDAVNGERALVMGILNVTPDSFSDGGNYLNVTRAVSHAVQMVQDGANIIDVGGESTRPGSSRVSASAQLERVIPVIKQLREALPQEIIISIDTTSSLVALAAINVGADLVNDVSAGLDDPDMFKSVASQGVPIVLMHMKGPPSSMQDHPAYSDVTAEIVDFLKQRVIAAESAGVASELIIIDPGIGFGKSRVHNLKMLADLHLLKLAIGKPILLGTSRKRFMGSICNESSPIELLGATVATTVFGYYAGVRIFRVHDVKPNRQALDVSLAILSANSSCKI